jgi:2-methylcitrate dehydratase PrpD
VIPVHDPLYGGDNRLGPAKVVVKTRDGATYERVLEFMYGDPRNPMEWADLVAKVRGCLAYRREPLEEDQINFLIRTIESIENLPDVTDLARRLA